MKKSPEVDKYIANAPAQFVSLLNETRADIFEILSDVDMEETYSYKIAMYKYKKKPLFSIAYFNDHCSLVTQDKDIKNKFPELSDFKISGTSIHFSPEKTLPLELLRKILLMRKASVDGNG